MKKMSKLIIMFSVLCILASVPYVGAQGSIAGDDRCGGSTPCALSSVVDIMKDVTGKILLFGFPLLVLVVIIYFGKYFFGKAEQKPAMVSEAKRQIGGAIIGLLGILFILSGLAFVLLQQFGLQEFLIKPFQSLSNIFITSAYAADDGTLLTSPTGSASIYDIFLTMVRIGIRWFVFPALLIWWVWSGFSYVLAQGKPEELQKANRRLMFAVLWTIVILVTEGFLFAVRNTVMEAVSVNQPVIYISENTQKWV